MNNRFAKKGKVLPAIYSLVEEVDRSTFKLKKIRIAQFPIYNSGKSICYESYKPISKMLAYETKLL